MTVLNCDVGDMPMFTATYTNSKTGAKIDPGTVKFGYRDPDGGVIEFVYPADTEISKVEDGVYEFVFEAAVSGIYEVRGWSEGFGKAAESGRVSVKENPLIQN